jgi:ADP-dependent NAD(P)H-hydrate dehydratase / NAD(P)H-hydrate epimerase
MKILTAAQVREVDRRSIEGGIPGLTLMENAGTRVVEFLAEKFAPLDERRITILCGKGNNGGDGLVVARQLLQHHGPRGLHVVLFAPPADLKGDAAENLKRFLAAGGTILAALDDASRQADIVVDALLGTGISGPPTGKILEAIRETYSGFPRAKIVAVDLPSGLASDAGTSPGEHVRADYTITFTAPKLGQVLPPNCAAVGELRVVAIGSPPELYEADDSILLTLVQPRQFLKPLAPRARDAHKGDFGHVLVIGGSPGKTGAAAMTAVAAMRSGAGLVTVASGAAELPAIAAHAPEMMTAVLGDFWPEGKWDVYALGPGLGTDSARADMVRRAVQELERPLVIDADGLNALALGRWESNGKLRVLTPHPGEMARLMNKTTAEIQADRICAARSLARERGVWVVLKGYRSLLAFPDGRVWVNPTGSPALAKGGSGDVLTGMIAAFLGQFPQEPEQAVAAAVYLHGLCGELAAVELGDKSVLATDLPRYFPQAVRECVANPDRL